MVDGLDGRKARRLRPAHRDRAAISDGTPTAWIDWDADIAALDGGRMPGQRQGERRKPQPTQFP